MLANAILQRTGSYAGLFLICAAMEACGGAAFCRLASVDVARETIAAREVAS